MAGDKKKKSLVQRIRGARDFALGKLAWVAVEVAESDFYARNTGRFLRARLLAEQPMRRYFRLVNLGMEEMGIPTRADVTQLAERLTNIEMRLDDMEALIREGLRKNAPDRAGLAARNTASHEEPS